MSQKSYLGSNLKKLRTRRRLSQQALADQLSIKRSTLSAYENKSADPPIDTLLEIASYFQYSLDLLVKENLAGMPEYKLHELEQSQISGKNLRVIATTVDQEDRENIELVSVKAKAGYTNGYADAEFIKELPRYRLPFLDPAKKYRSFQISGDSMLPIADKSWVTGEYVIDWRDIKNGEMYIILTKNEGVVFKVVYNKIEEKGELLLVSTNTEYEPYSIPTSEIVELWKYVHHFSIHTL